MPMLVPAHVTVVIFMTPLWSAEYKLARELEGRYPTAEAIGEDNVCFRRAAVARGVTARAGEVTCPSSTSPNPPPTANTAVTIMANRGTLTRREPPGSIAATRIGGSCPAFTDPPCRPLPPTWDQGPATTSGTPSPSGPPHREQNRLVAVASCPQLEQYIIPPQARPAPAAESAPKLLREQRLGYSCAPELPTPRPGDFSFCARVPWALVRQSSRRVPPPPSTS